MIKKIACIVLLFLFLLPQNMFANGGTGEGYALLAGGNIKFVNTPDIFVLKEDLNIILSPRTSVVTAEYTLKNTGPARELSYIFPVTQYVTEYYDKGDVNWIEFYDGKQKLSFTKIDEQIPQEADSTDSGYDYYSERTATIDGEEIRYRYLINSYYHTELIFGVGETKVLTVSYEASNSFESGGTSKSLLSYFSDVTFLYDLSPASTWGNGQAAEFQLAIDYRQLRLATNLTINLGNFSRQPSGIYRYSARDFDFAEQGMIKAVFYYPFELEELREYQKNSDWLSKVYVTSTLKSDDDTYSARNLFDDDPNTVWSSDGKGVGESIELLFEKGASIGILNGYLKNENVYYNNARIKKLKVELWSTDFQSKKLRYPYEYEVSFADIPYTDIDKNNPLSALTLLATGDYPKDFMRLTVLEAYPGRQSQDLCLSGIYLFSQNDRWDDISFGFGLSPISIYDNYADILAQVEAAQEKTWPPYENPLSPSDQTQENASATITPTPSDEAPLTSIPLEDTEPGKNHTALAILIILVLLTLCAGGIIYMHKKKCKHDE